MTQQQIKRKLQALSVPGVPAMLTDFLKVIMSDIGAEDPEATDSDYAKATQRLMTALKVQYREQLQVQDIVPKQRDLEVLIAEIKQEEQWKKGNLNNYKNG